MGVKLLIYAVLILAVVGIIFISGCITEPKKDSDRETITIVGKYSLVGNPCTTDPCLPGIVSAVIANDKCYYLTVNGRWFWSGDTLSWEGYTPSEGDYVIVEGYLSEKIDIFNKSFYEIEVISLKPE